ncbi:hypothetical protein [Vibrio campbellii]|uniref:hypothetical protein n=1 Tax=Vibrio campbellii TaxID=680 RepID=UPI003857850C
MNALSTFKNATHNPFANNAATAEFHRNREIAAELIHSVIATGNVRDQLEDIVDMGQLYVPISKLLNCDESTACQFIYEYAEAQFAIWDAKSKQNTLMSIDFNSTEIIADRLGHEIVREHELEEEQIEAATITEHTLKLDGRDLMVKAQTYGDGIKLTMPKWASNLGVALIFTGLGFTKVEFTDWEFNGEIRDVSNEQV